MCDSKVFGIEIYKQLVQMINEISFRLHKFALKKKLVNLNVKSEIGFHNLHNLYKKERKICYIILNCIIFILNNIIFLYCIIIFYAGLLRQKVS